MNEPVTLCEKHRNSTIHDAQGDRNPLIEDSESRTCWTLLVALSDRLLA